MKDEFVTDPREMRKILTRMMHTGQSEFEGAGRDFSCAAALVRRTMHAAEYAGLSGEDAYTLLAYYALIQLERLSGMALENVMLATSVQTASKPA